ncbi:MULTISPECIES: hypothetical protein [unclassified Ensifer]|uniref:hypothetical protein n=1 Tax=unclassified Ensifer TaxID=2633371 RepID=UPI0012E3AC8A|nr:MULTISPECIES: hypothetical protein [unclassified Ensifer]
MSDVYLLISEAQDGKTFCVQIIWRRSSVTEIRAEIYAGIDLIRLIEFLNEPKPLLRVPLRHFRHRSALPAPSGGRRKQSENWSSP